MIICLGRYNKFNRELPQTPWILDGKRVMESSVEERIADPLKTVIKMDGKLIVLFSKTNNSWSRHLSILKCIFGIIVQMPSLSDNDVNLDSDGFI